MLSSLRAQGTDPESLWLQGPEGNGGDVRGKGGMQEEEGSAMVLKAKCSGAGAARTVAQFRQWEGAR